MRQGFAIAHHLESAGGVGKLCQGGARLAPLLSELLMGLGQGLVGVRELALQRPPRACRILEQLQQGGRRIAMMRDEDVASCAPKRCLILYSGVCVGGLMSMPPDGRCDKEGRAF